MPDAVALAVAFLVRAPSASAKVRRQEQLARVEKESVMVRYSQAFKKKMVQKMVGPSGVSPAALAGEVGVSESSLYRWQDEAGTVPAVTKKTRNGRGASSKAKRPQDWTPAQKLEAVMEAGALSDDELGEFLRRKGLHEAQLEQWREQLQAAAPEVFGKRQRRSNKPSPEQIRIRELEKELRRKDKALAETAALLVLKKKAQAIWGDEDDDTDPRSDR